MPPLPAGLQQQEEFAVVMIGLDAVVLVILLCYLRFQNRRWCPFICIDIY